MSVISIIKALIELKNKEHADIQEKRQQYPGEKKIVVLRI